MLLSVSRRLSTTGIRFSGHPVPAEGLGLPRGRLTTHQQQGGPRRGFHVPHSRVTTGMGALSTPGTSGALLTECRARPAPATSRRPVPTPRPNIPSRGATIHGASTKVHAIHPSGLPLTRDLHDGTEILRLSPGLRTPPSPATHIKAGTGPNTSPGYATDITNLHRRSHSPHATSCRTT